MSPRLKKTMLIAWVCFNLLIAAGTVASAYGGVVNPNVTPVPAVLAMTFRFWLIGNLLTMAVDLFVSRKTALIPLLAFICSYGPLRSVFPINLFTEKVTAQNADRSLSVVSYNVHTYLNYREDTSDNPRPKTDEEIAGNEMIDYLLSTNADILFLQESPTLKTNRTCNISISQSAEMAARYPYVHQVKDEMIVSKYPLEPIDIPIDPNNGRRIVAAKADIDGHQTLLMCVHLQSLLLTNDDKELYMDLTEGEAKHKIKKVRSQLLSKLASAFRLRADQAAFIREKIDSIGIETVILGGDFNDIADCYAMRKIAGSDFHNAFNDAGNGMIITYHDDRFYFHIDHILYRGPLKAVEFEKGKCPASDHYPVEAMFLWDEKSNRK